jgi:DNA repair protein RadA/Sms
VIKPNGSGNGIANFYAEASQHAVLGSLALNNALMSESTLAVEDFVGSRDQLMYRLMLQLCENGESFDPVVLAQRLAERGILDTIGGPAYLGQLTDGAVPQVAVFKTHCQILQRLSKLRRLRHLGESAIAGACDPRADPELLLAEFKRRVEALVAGRDLAGNILPYASTNFAMRPELLRLSNVEAAEVDWVWAPYLPSGMLCMLSGDPGCGKTYLAMAMAAALSKGRTPYSGVPCEALNLLYMSLENSPAHVLRPRFDQLGGDPAKFHIVRGSMIGEGENAKRGSIRLSDLDLLTQALAATGAKLLIVDPIQSYLGSDVDSHRSNETRPILDGLARLAEEHHCAVLLVRHFAKATAGRAIHRGLGSIDFTGAVRVELHAGLVNDQHVMVTAKSNLGPFGKSLGYAIEGDGLFRWTGEADVTAGDLQMAEPTGDERGALDEAVWHLSEALKDGPKTAKEVQRELREAGLTEATVRRAKTKLGVVSQKTAMNGAWMWVLPGTEDAQTPVTQNLEHLRGF